MVPIDRANVDTDAILPKQFLKSIKRTGFGVSLFEEARYLDDWYAGIDYSKRPLNMDFVLNYPCYKDASILIARDNFGCGSSREHAVWALDDYGIKVVIAPSFGDIFFNNCFKNGVLAVVLSNEQIDQLFEFTLNNENDTAFQLTVDLKNQKITTSDISYSFEIDAFRKNCLLEGLDEIGVTLKNRDNITEFEANHKAKYPWLFNEINP